MISELPVFPRYLVWQLWMYCSAVVLTGLGWEGGPDAHLRSHVVSSAILQPAQLFPCVWLISQIELQNSSCNKLWIQYLVMPFWCMWKPHNPLKDLLTWVSMPPSYLVFNKWSLDCFDLKIWLFLYLHTLFRYVEVNFFSRWYNCFDLICFVC